MAPPVQQEWIPWITRAVVTHFHELTRSGLYVQIPNAPDERANHAIWADIRIDGPIFQYSNPDSYMGYIIVDILIQAQKSHNVYSVPALFGEVAEKFVCIRVLKDDGSLLGILDLEPGYNGNDVEIADYGLIPDTGHRRGTVVGRYSIHLEV